MYTTIVVQITSTFERVKRFFTSLSRYSALQKEVIYLNYYNYSHYIKDVFVSDGKTVKQNNTKISVVHKLIMLTIIIQRNVFLIKKGLGLIVYGNSAEEIP